LHVLTSVYMFEIIDIEHYKDEQPFYRSLLTNLSIPDTGKTALHRRKRNVPVMDSSLDCFE